MQVSSKSRPSGNLCFSNTFELLNDVQLLEATDFRSEVTPVDDVSSIERVLEEQKLFGSCADVQKLVHNCSSCGKTLIGKSVSGKCLKCSNHSFKNLPDQLVSSECVGDRVLSASDPVADVSNCEIVPLKQFARAGKRGHYLSFGVCMIDAESAMPALDVSKLSNNLTKDQ